jgi:hypothetical protein
MTSGTLEFTICQFLKAVNVKLSTAVGVFDVTFSDTILSQAGG